MEKRHWTAALADRIDLSGEPMPGQPVVELAGDRRVLIEGHRGIREYSGQQICVNVRYGAVCITGASLELTKMTAQQLVISGRIDNVKLQRRDR